MKIFHFMQGITFIPLRMIYPTKFIGKKNIPKGPCIIASNHRSNMDAILLAVHTFEKKYYLAKKELFSTKFKNFLFTSIGGIKVDREANDVGAIREALKVLKNKKKLVVFPEGRRVNNENDEMGDFKNGVSMFAIKAKVPIVPMYITKKPKAFRRNRVYIGKPFTLEEYYGKKLTNEELNEAGQKVNDKLQELREYSINALTKKK